MLKIGHFNATRYWQKYAFAHPPEGMVYKRAIDLPCHLTKTTNQFLLNTKWVLPLQGLDFLHTYNSIIPYNIPWIIEVESTIPRYGKMNETDKRYQWAIKRLLSDSCKKILFTSQSAKKLNEQRMFNWGIPQSKMSVLYRAVEIHNDLSKPESTFNILFAGNGFYRKGGMELLKAFQQITNKDIRLTIISSFEIDWKIIPSQAQINWVKKVIANDDRITVKSNIPHDQVVQYMQKAHVFVATTLADPFNNTILEAMACGTAIISSNIGAIPEFVEDKKNGYVCNVHNLTSDETVYFIKEKIISLFNSSDLSESMRSESMDIAKNKFSIERRNAYLKTILCK